MMENAIYSVISPEGCASIMWRDASKKELRRRGYAYHGRRFERARTGLTVSFPSHAGGAHTDHETAAAVLETLHSRAQPCRA